MGKCLFGGEGKQKLTLSSHNQLCQEGAYFYFSFLLTAKETETWGDGWLSQVGDCLGPWEGVQNPEGLLSSSPRRPPSCR